MGWASGRGSCVLRLLASPLTKTREEGRTALTDLRVEREQAMSSGTASVVSGVLDSVSSGILLYTATVELIVRPFLLLLSGGAKRGREHERD